MAVIGFARADLLFTDYVLGASGTITPPTAWTVGLSGQAVSTFAALTTAWNSTPGAPNATEIGGTTANNYSRPTINKDQTAAGWLAGVTDTTGKRSDGKQVTFGAFSPAGPTPNGAQSWLVTDGTTLNAGQVYVAGDTGATRTFANGDTEKVTPSIKVIG